MTSRLETLLDACRANHTSISWEARLKPLGTRQTLAPSESDAYVPGSFASGTPPNTTADCGPTPSPTRTFHTTRTALKPPKSSLDHSSPAQTTSAWRRAKRAVGKRGFEKTQVRRDVETGPVTRTGPETVCRLGGRSGASGVIPQGLRAL